MPIRAGYKMAFVTLATVAVIIIIGGYTDIGVGPKDVYLTASILKDVMLLCMSEWEPILMDWITRAGTRLLTITKKVVCCAFKRNEENNNNNGRGQIEQV